MVADKNNKIYTDLLNYMRGLYPNFYGGTEYNEGNKKFPFLYFTQIDGSTVDVTLSNTEESINLAFQIEVYTDGGTNLARKMSNDVRNYMISEGFHCKNFMPLTTFSNVSRFVGRYERLDV